MFYGTWANGAIAVAWLESTNNLVAQRHER